MLPLCFLLLVERDQHIDSARYLRAFPRPTDFATGIFGVIAERLGIGLPCMLQILTPPLPQPVSVAASCAATSPVRATD